MPFQTIFLKVCINFSPALQGVGEWEEGRCGWGEGWGWRKKTPQVKTRGHYSCPQMVLRMQLGRRDIIPVKGKIPGR